MGFKIRWDAEDIKRQLHCMFSEMNSGYNDGWIQWSAKKELLNLKFLIDELLEKSSSFGETESAYFAEKAKEKTWKVLSDK